MIFEWGIAWKYYCSKKHHSFINVIKNISILGVAVGVGALIIVLAVMNGFETDLKKRIIGIYAHAVIEGDGAFKASDELINQIRSTSEDITGLSPFIQAQSLIESQGFSEGVLVTIPQKSPFFVSGTIDRRWQPACAAMGGIRIGPAMGRALSVTQIHSTSTDRILSPGGRSHDGAGIAYSPMACYQ